MSQFLELYYRSKNNHLLHSGVTQTLYMIFSIIISIHYQVYVLVQVVYTSSTKAAAQAWQNKICMRHSVLQSLIPGQDYPYALQTHKLKTGYTEGSQHQQQACTALNQTCFHTQVNDHIINTKTHHCCYCL